MPKIDSAIYEMAQEEQSVVVELTYAQASFLLNYFNLNEAVFLDLVKSEYHGWQNLEKLSGAMASIQQGVNDAKTMAHRAVHECYD